MHSTYNVSVNKNVEYSIEGESELRELNTKKVVAVEADTKEAAFVAAGVWLSENPGYTLISVAFTYLFEEDEVQLLLTVE